jgi:hypothetical protein
MRTSEVLNRAADLIQERGWVQGEGWSGVDDRDGLCLEGGIMAAAGISGFGAIGDVQACPAYKAVADYIGLDLPGGATFAWRWNDSQNRTATEVIETLRAAAVIESARESELAAVSA